MISTLNAIQGTWFTGLVRFSDNQKHLGTYHKADLDGSFWSASSSDDFYLLGDAVCEGCDPCRALIRVKEISSSNILQKAEQHILIQPTGNTQIWNDSGSGARQSVNIYSLSAPTGYKCLGHIAVGSNDEPDLNKYRCVRDDYVENVLMSHRSKFLNVFYL